MSGRILIVDDQAVMLRLVGHPLEAEGFTILTAMSGAEALSKVQSEQPDLVILDVMLPDANGIEICHRIRQGMNLVDLPIIILSGQTDLASKIHGLEAGADEYVTKPVDPKEIVARVKALLARSQRMHQTQAPNRQGRVIGFIGAKGGVGTTTVALNVALAMALRGRKAIAVELRPYYGAFTRQLGLKPTATLSELLELVPKSINERQLLPRLLSYTGGLQVLVGPQQLKDYRDIQPEQVDALLSVLTQICEYTVLDLPHMPSVANRAALRACQGIYLVLEADPPTLAAAQALMELLRAWGITTTLVKAVIVNRAQVNYPLAATDIERVLGCEIAATIQATPDLALNALTTGRPLVISAPDSLTAKGLMDLAERVVTYLSRSFA